MAASQTVINRCTSCRFLEHLSLGEESSYLLCEKCRRPLYCSSQCQDIDGECLYCQDFTIFSEPSTMLDTTGATVLISSLGTRIPEGLEGLFIVLNNESKGVLEIRWISLVNFLTRVISDPTKIPTSHQDMVKRCCKSGYINLPVAYGDISKEKDSNLELTFIIIRRMIFIDGKHLCSCCQKPEASKRCSACKTDYYCDRECQKRDYPVHRRYCNIAPPFVDPILLKKY